MLLNRNHAVPARFVTLAHELGHLFLGHLGPDKVLSVPRRQPLSHAEQELEAESVAYLVATRSGITPKSQPYLSNFVKRETTIDDIDAYQVMRAAGQVETLLGLISPTRFQSSSLR
jgi:antirestriction protein ArdC